MKLANYSLCCLVALALLFAPAAGTTALAQPPGAPPAAALQTVAVVAASSYDEMLSDVGFMGGLGDRPEAGQMIEGFIALFTQGKGLTGLDKSKPWGVVVQTDGVQFMPIGCLPVSDLDELLALAEAFVVVNDREDGVKELEMPNGPPLFIKSAGGWAYLGQSAAALDSVPADPAALLGDLTSEYDLVARISIANVPEIYRNMAIEQIKAGMQEGLEREADEDEDEYEMRKRLAETQIAQFQRMLEEIEEVTFGMAVDAAGQQAFADFTYKFQPGSKFAQQLEAYSDATTNYAGFYQPDAALTLTFASQTDPELIQEDIEQFKTMINTARQQAAKAIDEEDDIPDERSREIMKSAVNDFIDALEATVETGQMDGGAVVNMQPESLTIVAGGLVKEPAKIESGMKKLIELAKDEPDFPGIAWNADSHAGVTFHTVQAPIKDEDEEVRQLFGPTLDIALGIGEESVYVAVGRDCLEAAKGIIDRSQAQPNKPVPPMEAAISLGQIMTVVAEFAEEDDREQVELIATMLRNEAQGRDHIRIVAQVMPEQLQYRMRIVAEEGVLRAVGKAAVLAQEEAATGGGF